MHQESLKNSERKKRGRELNGRDGYIMASHKAYHQNGFYDQPIG